MYLREGQKNPDRSCFDWPGFILITAAGGIISSAVSGFVFGVGTNVFHLPIVARLYDEPQFINDAFIQSLRYYSSGVWLLLRGADRWIEAYWLFLGLAIFSRILFFSGFMACASLAGILGRKERTFFVALLSATELLRGSAVGAGSLFANTFSHSDFANGLFLIALYLSIRCRIGASVALTGVTFFVNAFMGAWTAAVVGVVILLQIMRKEVTWLQGLLRAGLGICFASPFVAVIIAAMLSNPEFGNTPDFDYAQFLKMTGGVHFFIESIPPNDLAALLLMSLCGAASFILIGNFGRMFLAALITACAIFAAGIVVPHITHAPLILNLHLLREAVLVQILSAFAITALVTLWFFQGDQAKSIVASIVAVAILANPLRLIALATLVLVLAYFLLQRDQAQLRRWMPAQLPNLSGLFRIFAVLTVTSFLGILFFKHRALDAGLREAVGEWTKVGTWARANTAPESIFLVPAADYHDGMTPEEWTALESTVFEPSSHRRVWIGNRTGCAAMWSYSYYHEWHDRRTEALALATHQDKLRYAHEKRLSYVIETCAEAGRQANLIFSTKRLCVYPVQMVGQTASN